VTQDNETFQKMNEISGMRTVPQIFVGEITKENLIGGFDDISVLHRENKLLHIMK
jgi:glutaredoxin